MSGRAPTARRRLALAAVLAVALAAGFGAHERAQVLTDTVVILNGVGTIDRCLDAGVTWNCNSAGLGDVGYFPPFQYVPAWLMKQAGFNKDQAASGLAAINGASLVLMIALGWLVLARLGARPAAPLFAAACLGSCLLWYATTTFGEALGALLTLGLAATVLLRAPPAVVLLAALAAGITKETAAPFLALLVAGCLLAQPREHWRRIAIAAAAGLVLAIAADAWLNLFRYGHVWNDFYVPSERPAAHLWPGIGAAMLVAPNAGVIWFLAPLVGLVAVVGAVALRSPERRPRLALACAALMFAALLVFFTTWYAPFGWQAWGPRLIVPWLPAIALMVLAADPGASTRAARLVVATRARAIATVAFLSLFGLPQLGALLDKMLPFRLFDEPCVSQVHGNSTYYPCLSDLAWGAKPMLLRAYGSLGAGGRVALAILFVGLLAGLVAYARAVSGSAQRLELTPQ